MGVVNSMKWKRAEFFEFTFNGCNGMNGWMVREWTAAAAAALSVNSEREREGMREVVANEFQSESCTGRSCRRSPPLFSPTPPHLSFSSQSAPRMNASKTLKKKRL